VRAARPAALLAAALAVVPVAAGLEAPPAGATHWSFPQQVSARALGSPDGYQLSLPWDLALAGERLAAVVSSPAGYGAAGTLVFARDGGGS